MYIKKNLGIYFGHSQKFQAQKCRFSLWNSSPRNSKIRTSLRWTVLCSQAPFWWHHSVRESLFKSLPTSLSTTTLGYGWSWTILFWAKHTPNSEMIALKIVKWIIAWKRKIFGDLANDAKSVAGISPSRQFRVGREWRHINAAWLPSQF